MPWRSHISTSDDNGGGAARFVWFCAATGIAYYLAAGLGLELRVPEYGFAAFWPAAGVGLGVLLVQPVRRWPWLLAVVLAVNVVASYWAGRPPSAALAFALANVLESACAAGALVWLSGPRPRLTGSRDVMRFGLVCVLVSNVVTATAGAWAGGRFGGAESFAAAWLGWFGADAVGMLTVAPLIMIAARPAAWPRSPLRLLEAAAVIAVFTAGLALIFSADPYASPFIFRQPSAFIIPVVIWACLRFRLPGSAVTNLIMGVVIVYFSSRGTGPFTSSQRNIQEEVQAAQVFLIVGAAGSLILAVVLDDLSRTQLALTDSEQRFRAFITHTPAACWIIDEHGRYVYVNETYERTFGLRRGSARGTTVFQAFPPAIARGFMETVATVLRTGRSQQAMEVMTTTGGAERHGLSFVFPLSEHQSPRLVGGVAVDITDRVTAEQRLKRLNETLEERIEERSRVAEERAAQLRALAHELTQAEQRERRRLAQILHDHLQQLLVAAKFKLGRAQDLPDGDPHRRTREDVGRMIDEAIRASRALTVELSPPVLYDGGLAAALHWLALRVREEQGMVVDVEAVATAEPPEDLRAFLFQSVRELLFNVVKHSGVHRARVLLAGDAEEIELTVEDDGRGFDMQRVGPRGGSGFGLFSIRERVTLLGGSFEIHSDVGQGTRVVLNVPLPEVVAASAAGAGHTPHAAVPAAGAEADTRVLVADDHKIFREGLAGLLRQEPGFAVVAEAADGEQAVDMALAHNPDIVLMDLTMPRLNGVEATRQLHTLLPTAQVIGLSMHDDPAIARAMRDAGAVAYLTKDTAAQLLVQTIRQVRAMSVVEPADDGEA